MRRSSKNTSARFSPRFIGVTGSRDELAAFAQQLNVAFMKVPDSNGGYVIDHTGNIVIVDPKGHYAGFMKLPHQADRILDGVQVDRAQDPDRAISRQQTRVQIVEVRGVLFDDPLKLLRIVETHSAARLRA